VIIGVKEVIEVRRSELRIVELIQNSIRCRGNTRGYGKNITGEDISIKRQIRFCEIEGVEKEY
jgi:hypothetical protein